MRLVDYLDNDGELEKVMIDSYISKEGFVAECIKVHGKIPHTVSHETWKINSTKTEVKNRKRYVKSYSKCESGHPDAKTVTVGYF